MSDKSHSGGSQGSQRAAAHRERAEEIERREAAARAAAAKAKADAEARAKAEAEAKAKAEAAAKAKADAAAAEAVERAEAEERDDTEDTDEPVLPTVMLLGLSDGAAAAVIDLILDPDGPNMAERHKTHLVLGPDSTVIVGRCLSALISEYGLSGEDAESVMDAAQILQPPPPARALPPEHQPGMRA